MADNRTQELAAVFRAAGSAHHDAFSQTDGDDPEWPLWYAEYLQEPLGKLFNTGFTRSELVYLLLSAEKDRQAEHSAPAWPEYYARFFRERYG